MERELLGVPADAVRAVFHLFGGAVGGEPGDQCTESGEQRLCDRADLEAVAQRDGIQCDQMEDDPDHDNSGVDGDDILSEDDEECFRFDFERFEDEE